MFSDGLATHLQGAFRFRYHGGLPELDAEQQSELPEEFQVCSFVRLASDDAYGIPMGLGGG
jgi:hypothetical protein